MQEGDGKFSLKECTDFWNPIHSNPARIQINVK